MVTVAGLDGILLDLPGGSSEPSDRPWALPGTGPEPEAAPAPEPEPLPTPPWALSSPAPEAPSPPAVARPSRSPVVGIVGIAAIGWIVRLAVGLTSVILAALPWSSRQL